MQNDNLPKMVTLSHVAKKAGFSLATVSRVLNHGGPASDETRRRILEVAKQQGYVPDPRFRLMGRRRESQAYRTGNIGVVLGQVWSPSGFVSSSFAGRLFWSLESEATKHGRNLILSTYGASNDQYVPRFVRDLHVDGVIVAERLTAGVVQRIAAIRPVVLVNIEEEDVPTTSFMPNEAASVRKALAYLSSLGHRRIAFFFIDDRNPPCLHHHRRREEFFALTQAEPGRFSPILAVLPRRGQNLVETAMNQLRAWTDSGQMPTALLCAADTYAIAFLEAAEKMGIRVPGDLSVMGVDDIEAGRYVRPKLTTMRHPLEAMGQAAIQAILQRIDASDDETPVKTVQLFDVDLIERESCGPCPQ